MSGIRSNSFDVVLGCNVLHATRNLTNTLTHVRQILKYGGYLVLSEVTFPSQFADATFGMTTGWWLFEDLDLRPDYPLLTSAQWRTFLTKTIGFDQVWVSSQQGPLRSQSVIVARAPAPSLMSISRPLDPPTPAGHQLAKEKGTVVLAGGLGGLGILTARLLLARGWRRFAFLSRSGTVSAGAEKEWQSFEQASSQGKGVEFKIWKVDVSDSKVLEQALAQIRHQLGPIMGVIQAAGILDSKTLINQDMDRFRKLMRPKVAGSWNLHQATLRDPLRFFALFSSMASVLGSAGQANHAAANSFMDSLACYRRAHGRPGISIQFSSVSEVGEAARRGADLRHTIGYMPIPKALARNGIEALIASDAVNVALSPIIWPKMLGKYRVAPKLFSAFAGLKAAAPPPPPPPPPQASVPDEGKQSTTTNDRKKQKVRTRVSEKGKLAESRHSKPRNVLPQPSTSRKEEAAAIIRKAVSEVLGYDIAHDDMPWQNAGVDSLLAIELRNAISSNLAEKGIRKDVSPTLIFDYPTVQQSVDFIARLIESGSELARASRAARPKPDSSLKKRSKIRSRAGASSPPGSKVRKSGSQNSAKKQSSPGETVASYSAGEVLALVLEAWKETMSTPIRPDQVFMDCGLDSLSSVELQFALQSRLEGLIEQVPDGLVDIDTTPRAVAESLIRQLKAKTGDLDSDSSDWLGTILAAWKTTVGGALGPNDDFVNNGLDSLSSVELHFAIQQAVGDKIEIPDGIFFTQRTAGSLAAWIGQHERPVPSTTGGAHAATEAARASDAETEANDSGDEQTKDSECSLSLEQSTLEESGSNSSESEDMESVSDESFGSEESGPEKDTEDNPKDMALQIVNSALEEVLGYTVDPHAPFTDSGVDSLSSLEIQNSLQSKVPGVIRIPATVVFDYPTAEKVAVFLVSQGLGRPRSPRKIERRRKATTSKPKTKPRPKPESRSKLKRRPTQASTFDSARTVRNDNVDNNVEDPIVIVGMASRFPGQKEDSVESWFDWLLSGQDAFVEVPHQRFDIDAVYQPGGVSQPGSSYVRHAAFIDGAEMFDHGFFGITEAEAVRIDPQQRLVLEMSYQALHCSGYTKQQLDGRDVGVFVGCCSFDWSKMAESRGSAYSGTGAAGSILSNRVSYALNLRGPSMTIDTACSSALVALDTAASALKEGKCTAAVVTAGMY